MKSKEDKIQELFDYYTGAPLTFLEHDYKIYKNSDTHTGLVAASLLKILIEQRNK